MSSGGVLGEPELLTIRHSRCIWIERAQKNPTGPLAHANLVALFVHGACGNAQQWREQGSFFHDYGLDTVIFDAFGCGKSARPKSFAAYHPDELYEDLLALVQRTLSAERVILIGHSFGCALSLRLTSSYPRLVAGLVLIGPFVPTDKKPPFFSLAAWLFYLPDWVLAWMQPNLTEVFLKAAFHPKTWHSQPALIEQERRASNRNPPHMFKAFYRQVGAIGRSSDFAAWASAVTQEVLVISGDSDLVTPKTRAQEFLIRNFQKCKVVEIGESSHQVMQEKPEAVNAVIQSFLHRL